MSTTGTVAIAGAGIAGFAAAASFAQRGFDVTVYERSQDPREFGAGIYLKDNSLPVLDALGVYDHIAAAGSKIDTASITDERGEVIVRRDVSRERLIVVLRAELHNALRDAATAAGVKLVTGKTVTGASADGVLRFDDRTEVSADVVIGADGVYSTVRESLGLTKSYRYLPDGATRVLIKRDGEGPEGREYWSGNRRVGVAPCGPELAYVFLIGPESNPRCGALPLDKDYWNEAFPNLGHVFDRIEPDSGVHHRHQEVTCLRWASGRVAIIGDAAHAQPPNFGQGAGLSIAAAYELARTVADGRSSADVPAQLANWESRFRPAADKVQRYTTWYSNAGYYWPRPALGLRSKFFHTLSVTPATAHWWEFWWRGGVEAPATYLSND
ncbi:FAD-dependent monooxygenase [Jatrophihabitans cynanchi]|jgi:2-polyprenyl-6-methoxyphenol hydroxylase-like FAD-dependent oxidoreductase|uniref:FAD-dependent monooxygenase n=1 Tax=Jatrophihabitans cynanchi TaxID=2944128 RepID=A0ABY7K297_9ACTN|nr:NAD(P)/FAD-dependent oxidoreductase [Jatrophihabitans sp. SB3-54]WAX58975.1 FAD-dependent monooxygenase [Jatrophihabitans sp. SB3-54]